MTNTDPKIPPFLVFGYGSLIWKPPPHVKRRIPGYITSHVRRFWQASEDHRGTVDAPGRVVTLVSHDDLRLLNLSTELQHESGKCWGAVYEIQPESVAEVKAYLDIREINGYSLSTVPFYPAIPDEQGGPIFVSVFIGTVNNPQFMPTTDLDLIAALIHERVGPSGPNKEYLFNLAQSLRDLHEADNIPLDDANCGDRHIDELMKRVTALDK